MKTLLHVKSSILGEHSQSSALAADFIARWQAAHPEGTVVVRDLAAQPIPHLDGERLGAFMSEEGQRNAEQQAVLDQSAELIDELRQADVVVMGIPMYNFSIPSQLKAWFDHIARAGVTFQYTENGPQGMLEDRPVVLFSTRGGIYHANGNDHQTPFLKQLLGLIGLQDLHFVYAEGLNMSGPQKDDALAQAQQQITQLVENTRQAA